MADLRDKATNAKPSVVKVISTLQQKTNTFQSTGSGFIVKTDGIVLSNSHVVINDDPIGTKVIFDDGVEKQCVEILFRDKQHDYIIFKIEGGDYQELQLGEYDDIKDGSEIYFCGFPLKSNHHTIHGGNVSSKFEEGGIRIIQIDGSVNSGNSGGPLLNMDDKVVGIITKKAGGVDEKLMEKSEYFKYSKSFFQLVSKFPDGTEISVDPNKILGEVIEIIHDYTSLGIGYAFSIEYAKAKLNQLNLI